MRQLIAWDFYMMITCFSLFMLMALSGTKISFAICKVLFALSAAPFFPLTIGVIGRLFTHADETAYTAEGKLTRLDSSGLSNYLDWLRSDLLESSRFQHELQTDFSTKDLNDLRNAVEDGEKFLVQLWAAPYGNVRRRCLVKKKEVVHKISSIITRERASDALYTHVFPNAVLIEGYEARLKRLASPRSTRNQRRDEENQTEAQGNLSALGAEAGSSERLDSPRPERLDSPRPP